MKLFSFSHKAIIAFLYLLFFITPFLFSSNTSELFELNKMWFVYGLTICIIFFWSAEMLLQRKIVLKRTPLDIPILFFLSSQLLSTIFSLDSYVSFWGYYSRFNGGLLSTITYIILYYALITHATKTNVIRFLLISLFAGSFVSLWGLPSHFGYDPTCFVFRGTLDVSCWTNAFQPMVRIFSTLGQPDWLGAYLGLLLPIALSFYLKQNNEEQSSNKRKDTPYLVYTSLFFLLSLLFYIDLLFTRAKSGFLGVWLPLIFFLAALYFLFYKNSKKVPFMRHLWYALATFIGITFFIGSPLPQLEKITLPGIMSHMSQPKVISPSAPLTMNTKDVGGTDSGKIRLLVWKGAIDAWKASPLLGSGVETFAYTYYRHRPAAHNMVSEWDYLYNKAHNEYLNYLATTGILGLVSYLYFIGGFLFLSLKRIIYKRYSLSYGTETKFDIKDSLIEIGLITSFISILITNFFGFSVVIVNLYLFLIPAFFFLLTESSNKNVVQQTFSNQRDHQPIASTPYQWIGISASLITCVYILYVLYIFWIADTYYGLGSNLSHVGDYARGYTELQLAHNIRPNEPVFSDELANASAALAVEFAQKKDEVKAVQFAQESISLSNDITTHHSQNVVFWKSRVRIFYTISQIDSRYITYSLQAVQKAQELAPTDAKISYNLGLLYGQVGNIQKAIDILQRTIKLKPDYADAYYALATFYHQQAIDAKENIIHPDIQNQANNTLDYLLKNVNPDYPNAKETLSVWEKK